MTYFVWLLDLIRLTRHGLSDYTLWYANTVEYSLARARAIKVLSELPELDNLDEFLETLPALGIVVDLLADWSSIESGFTC